MNVQNDKMNEDEVQELINHLRQQQVHLWVENNNNIKFRAPEGVMTTEIINKLKEAKLKLLKILSSSSSQETLQPDQKNRFKKFPLTDVQAAYFIGRKNFLSYGGVGCHGYFEILAPKWDEQLLTRIWNSIINRHDMLRAIVLPSGEQQIFPTVSHFPIHVDTLKRKKLREKMSHRVYEIDKWPLFDIKISRCSDYDCLHFSIDLLIVDFLSVQILLFELFKGYYSGELDERPFSISFRDFILYENKRKNSPIYEEDRSYWLSRLETLPVGPQLPLLGERIPLSPSFERYEFQLSTTEWKQLKQISQKRGVSLSSLLLTIFSQVIAYWSETPHFTLNVTVMNRQPIHSEIDKLVGDFTSVTLLEVNLTKNKTLDEYIQQIQTQLWSDLSHQTFSGIEVLREWGRKIGKEKTIMPIVFTSALMGEDQYQEQESLLTDNDLIFDYGISQTPQVWIDCQAMLVQGKLHLNWDVMKGVFFADIINDMFCVFKKTIKTIIRSPSVLAQPFSVDLPETQYNKRRQINQTKKELPLYCLHETVITQASSYPNSIAIIDGETTLTYKQLLKQSNQLATKLESQQRYAILIPKGAHQVISILAILIAGSAYIPIDYQQPKSRILQIIHDAQVKALISIDEQPTLQEHGIVVLALNDFSKWRQIKTKKVSPKIEDLAYIIYTSGSSGRPKGVMISHNAANNTISDIQQRINMTSTDTILALANIGFDLSVFDIFGILGVGGKIVFPDEKKLSNPSHWSDLINMHQVTIWNSVPAQMSMLLEYLCAEQIVLNTVRYVLLSGDWIPVSLPKAIKQKLPNSKQLALGGATEASIWSNYWIIDPEINYDPSIPYGIPLSNQQFRIVNYRGQDCPDWVTGELWIGGHGVALGYWQDEEKTATQFITSDNGERWYRTGDLGRYNNKAVIEFLGRLDQQIKINGYRIEAGEIEAHLLKFDQVGQAAVIKTTQEGIDSLHAYISPAFQAINSAVSIQHTKHLQKSLNKISFEAEKLASTLDQYKIKRLCILLDEAALMHMLKALLEIGAISNITPMSFDKMMEHGGIAKENQQLLRRWIRVLKQHNFIQENVDGFKAIQKISEEKLSLHWTNCQDLMKQLGDEGGLLAYLTRSNSCLPQLLQGKADPLQLLFPEGSLEVATQTYQNNLISRFMNQILLCAVKEKVHFVNQMQKRTIKILEIGAGVGGTSNVLIPLLAENKVIYTFTDISVFFLNKAQERYSQYNFIEYQLFDFNQSLAEQGFDYGQYDLVISSNVLHNAIVARKGLANLKKLLSPGGWLLIIEATRDNYQLMTSMEFKHGLTDFKDERMELDSPFMSQQKWLSALKDVHAEHVWAYPSPDSVLSEMGQSFILAQFNNERVYCDPNKIRIQLRDQLPEYMLPNRLILLDRLPFSVNGKIDRKKLSQLFKNSSYKKPISSHGNDALQKQLLELCHQVLGHTNLGIDDDFFVNGGDSLLVTQWINQIRDTLGAEKVPWDDCLRFIFQQPTVRALSDFLRRLWQTPTTIEDITTLNKLELSCLKKGEKPPVILFHEGSGTLFPYRALIDQLSGSVYGFTITDYEKFLSLPTNNLINALALRYLSQIEAMQQPFHLVGYCMGGMIAYEVSRQLIERGHLVASLTVISSYQIPYFIEDPLMIDFIIGKALGLNKLWKFSKYDLEILYENILLKKPTIIRNEEIISMLSTQIGSEELLAKYKEYQLLSKEKQFEYLLDELEDKNNTLPLQQTRQQWKQLCRIFRHSILGMCQHQPKYFAGDMTFYCQQSNTYLLPTLQKDMTEFWKRHCLGQVQVSSLPGDHFSCLSENNLTALVQRLEINRENKYETKK